MSQLILIFLRRLAPVIESISDAIAGEEIRQCWREPEQRKPDHNGAQADWQHAAVD